ncbi:MAG: sigma-54-dependent transcriptional regulator [Planctomycetota bacterium]|jgi:two-component system response regulator HydG/two-component system response regulator AtoC
MAIASVVVADDEFLNRDLLAEIFTRLDIEVRTVKDGVQALRALEEQPADLLVTDIRMPGMGGMKLLHKAKEKWPQLPVVMMTAYASVESAVASMREGAYDYLLKPFGVEQVEALLLRLNERQQLVRQVAVLKEEVRDRHRARSFLGSTPIMRDVFTMIERAARSNATVLVRGESGTGKELVARALHEQSPRAEGPFVKVNCAALTESLLASELFGHERGSFTGAEQQRIGRFELADGGTLLLDEISEISPEMQAKLLRVLEEREFERVGGERPIAVDVRIIATTNRDLQAEVADGAFREDLYYRLNVIPVQLPPLRERQGDVGAILDHYLAHFGAELGCKPQLADDARALLCAYAWPGNVRELVNIVERLVVLGGDGVLDGAVVRRCLPELGDASAPSASVVQTLEAVERAHVEATLTVCGGDRKAAADVLGIGAKALANRLAKYAAD